MVDRQVQQILPQPTADAPANLSFAALLFARNIVLLGDPGSGKTHLFRAAAEATNGRYMTVRTFLNRTANWGDAILFLDALDERRSGRGDNNVVDSIVRKLFECPPARLRLSCRAQDWLGESDLEAFKPYFDENDGVIVVSLSALTEGEQRSVFNEHGFENFDAFLETARERGLSEFLKNPQDLMMLATAVREGTWPETRLELFQMATQRWLTEHNPEHSRKDEYPVDALRSVVGALCALRLISNIEGFTLDHIGIDDVHPGTGEIQFLDPRLVQAALHRRVFTSLPGVSAVDYTHRTTAEYLAAEWLGTRLGGGLSFRRLSALLGHEGRPATELRGLHAWLATFAPRFAEQLINADPYGVLSYGDPAALFPSSRVALLDALSRLSARDPWFKFGDAMQRMERSSGMCGPEMTAPYREILRSTSPDRAMRMVVLEALSAGTPNAELTDDLGAVVIDSGALLAERELAIHALMKLGNHGRDVLLKAYQSDIGWDPTSLQVRAVAISEAYGTLFGIADVVGLLAAIEDCPEQLVGRLYLWNISDAIPAGNIPPVLDAVRAPDDSPDSLPRNESTVSHLLSFMLVKLLRSDYTVPPASLWSWLEKLTDDRASSISFSSLKGALLARKDLLLDAVSEGLGSLTADAGPYFLLRRLQAMTAGVVSEAEFIDLCVGYLKPGTPETASVSAVYQLALWLTVNHASEHPAHFEYLYTLGELETLRPIRDSLLSVELSEHRLAEARRRNEARTSEQADREKLLTRFATHEQAIRQGSESGWLGWVARVYLGWFSDIDHSLAPRQRLLERLGDAYTESALDGLRATVDRPDIPDVRTVVEAFKSGSFPNWWLALIAGLDLRLSGHRTIEEWSDRPISAALAINLLHPSHVREGNVTRRKVFGWETAALLERGSLVRDVYLEIARTELDSRREQVTGLGELLSMDAFAWCRVSVAMSILEGYPNTTVHFLGRLLEVVVNDHSSRDAFVSLARTRLASDTLEPPAYCAWLVAAFLACPEEFGDSFIERARDDAALLWGLRDALQATTEHGRRADKAFNASLLERITSVAAAHFPDAPQPANGWMGNRNPWDGAEFVKKLVNMVSLKTDTSATAAMDTLAKSEALKTYRDYVLHAAAEQGTRRRDAEYQQPDWAQTVAALTNGAPANIEDFHAQLIDTLLDISDRVANANNNIYKRFWNEDGSGKTVAPKPEESGRDVLIDFLRERLGAKGIVIEPEGRMVNARRADVVAQWRQLKMPVEIKRNYHADVWNAPTSQLDMFYTGDPGASGYGIYTVFWFGRLEGKPMPRNPKESALPSSASEMAKMLVDLLPVQRRSQIAIIVIDVSGQPQPAAGRT